MTKRKPPVQHRVRVVLKAPEKAAELMIHAQLVHDQMQANAATFPAPDPPLSDLQARIDELKAAASHAATGRIGSNTKREAAAARVRDALEGERVYVEKLATADHENAAVIAAQAAMHLFGRSFIHKPALALKHGPVSGCILAIAAAIEKAMTYDWQLSTDGGVTWVGLPMTSRADTKIEGLKPASTVHVRVRSFLRHSERTDWVDPVQIIVI